MKREEELLFNKPTEDNKVLFVAIDPEVNTVFIGEDIEIAVTKRSGRRSYLAISLPDGINVSRSDQKDLTK